MNYVFVLTYAAITNNEYISYNSTDLLNYYIQDLITTENELSNDVKQNFINNLGEYKTFFDDISSKNICSAYYKQAGGDVVNRTLIADFKNCTVLADSTLKHGFQSSF